MTNETWRSAENKQTDEELRLRRPPRSVQRPCFWSFWLIKMTQLIVCENFPLPQRRTYRLALQSMNCLSSSLASCSFTSWCVCVLMFSLHVFIVVTFSVSKFVPSSAWFSQTDCILLMHFVLFSLPLFLYLPFLCLALVLFLCTFVHNFFNFPFPSICLLLYPLFLLLLFFVSCIFLLSLLLKMMPLIKRMVRSSHSASSCYFSPHFIPVHVVSSVVVTGCGHTAPCCKHLFLPQRSSHRVSDPNKL